MFKEQKTNTVVLGLFVILGILLVTPIAKAALDIKEIYISVHQDLLAGIPDSDPWEFDLGVYLEDPDTLHHIDVTPPVGGTPFTIYEDDGVWKHYDPTEYPTLPALQADYPPGNYTFDFRDSMNTLLRSVTLDNSGISEDGSPVNLTYPSEDGQKDISIYPTFTWTVDPGAGDALDMWLDYDDEAIYENGPVPMGTTSWQPGPLNPELNYWLYVSVYEIKDWAGGPGWPTMIVDGDEFEYVLLMEYCNEISFTTVALSTLSGWVWMESGTDLGYSLNEGDLVYFVSSDTVWNLNLATGQWVPDKPAGWIYINWPFYYKLDTGDL
ncbi:MAG: hypothetical protein ACYS6K_28335, partial [Planctomycetota bacterium]